MSKGDGYRKATGTPTVAKGDREAWYALNLQRIRNNRARHSNFSDYMRLNWLLTNSEFSKVFRSRSEIDKQLREAIRQGVELDGRRKA